MVPILRVGLGLACACVCVCVVVCAGSPGTVADERRAALPFDGACLEPRDICPSEVLEEPSAVVHHAGRGTLFAVGDEGDVVELRTDGTRVRSAHLGPVDIEGITVGPGDRLYVAEEGPPAILVLDPATLAVERRIEVDPVFEGKPALFVRGDAGLEGLCYVPELHAFFAVNQLAPARLVELDVPAEEGKARVKRIVAELDGSVICASDLAWDAVSGHFLVVSSHHEARPGKLWELTADG